MFDDKYKSKASASTRKVSPGVIGDYLASCPTPCEDGNVYVLESAEDWQRRWERERRFRELLGPGGATHDFSGKK